MIVARLPTGECIIRGDRIAHFLHLARRRNHPLTRQDGGDLLLAQRIAFDGQQAVNGHAHNAGHCDDFGL